MEFAELNLHPSLQQGISEAGYLTCMPVQEQVLTNAFGGQDLYVQSQTGTGKTAAFLVVIFQRLLTEPLLSGKKALVMVPTRELAVQVEEEAKLLGKYLSFKIGSFYGGVGYSDQQRLLKDNVQILVGTPGRVLDLNASGKMNLMDIAFLVLDEADRMFDMGFYPDLRKLIKVISPVDRRQTMLFSATLNNWVKNLAWEYTKSPREIEIAPENVTVEEIDQILYHVSSEGKMRLLLGILEREKPESAIIFCNTKRYAEIVAKRLRLNGIACEFLMGDLPQSKRLKIIDDVKAGKTRFLVATDVAARGLDIEALSMVVNYDLPVEEENYVHRIGRTARAGKSGRAITLASEQDVYELPAIERYIGRKIPSQIGTEELFGEDKSAGMRVRTERCDDDRRPDSRGRGNERSGGRRSPSSGGEARRRPDRGREHGRSAENVRGRDEQRSPRKDRAKSPPGPDISGLSFEDRMAYYKQKYDPASGPAVSENPEAGGRNAGGGQAPGRDGRGNRNRERPAAGSREGTAPGGADAPRRKREAGKRAGRQPASKQASGRQPDNKQGTRQAPRAAARQERGKADGESGTPRTNSASVSKAAAQGGGSGSMTVAAPQKQGLVNRLLGIFKPKKQKE
ncbi:MAG: DEAD/DEAH box helicase [Treponema sp.]|jgi:ATP-dependent RNA helicase RhlB|nr:DEAD/DEAH box helicase [Treponema sp.]